MAGKTISVWLNGEEAERFQSEADDRGVSLSVFLKRCADTALATPDPRAELRAFVADLRADLRGEFGKVTEVVALNDERNRAASEELQRIHLAFLHDLNEQQRESVKVALGIGRQHGQAEAIAAKKSPAKPILPPATPL